ncbi:MAG: hypothetical protein ABI655_04805 [Phenylobacterium sp.]
MRADRSLFGDGPYPDTGPLVAISRLAFLGAFGTIVVMMFVLRDAPDFVHSHYLQHFAAFYVATLCALAALPRARIRSLVTGVAVFATGLEAVHLFFGPPAWGLVDNWVADLGGVTAAVVPVVVDRFRRRFPRPPRI